MRRSLDSTRGRWARRLGEQLVPLQAFEAALGDLAEEYALRSGETSRPRASGWYWGQLVRSLPSMMWLDIRQQGVASTFATAVGAWIVASAIESLAQAAMTVVLGADVGALPHFFIGIGAIGLGGYLAALVRPAAPKILAAIVFVVVIGLMVASPERVPVWFALGFLLLGPLVSIAGGTWRSTQPRS